jgi:hypothetical protein
MKQYLVGRLFPVIGRLIPETAANAFVHPCPIVNKSAWPMLGLDARGRYQSGTCRTATDRAT